VKSTDVSDKYIASIVRDEELSKQETGIYHAAFFMLAS
jgi:hypothetical protein